MSIQSLAGSLALEQQNGIDPAYLNKLKNQQQQLALARAFMEQGQSNMQNKDKWARLGGALQNIGGLINSYYANQEIENARKQDELARAAAQDWQTTNLGVDYERAMNPLLQNKPSNDEERDLQNRANEGYRMIEEYQRQQMPQNNYYAQQMYQGNLSQKIQEAMQARAEEQKREQMIEDENRRFAREVDLMDYRQAQNLERDQAKNDLAIAKADAIAKSKGKYNELGQPITEEWVVPNDAKAMHDEVAVVQAYEQGEQSIAKLQKAIAAGEDYMTNNPNAATESELGAILKPYFADFSNWLGSADGRRIVKELSQRGEIDQASANAVLQNLGIMKGVLSDNDVKMISQSILGSWNKPIRERLRVLKDSLGYIQQKQAEALKRPMQYISGLQPGFNQRRYNTMNYAWGTVPKYKEALAAKMTELQAMVESGQISPQQGQAAMQQVAQEMDGYGNPVSKGRTLTADEFFKEMEAMNGKQ